MPFEKYNYVWKNNDALGIEFAAIRRGGRWEHEGKQCGEGLEHHYREAWKLLWPNEDNHRWSDLILKTYCENDISVLVGCSDSSKTHTMSKIVLSDYWCFPDKTLWLVSTTEGRGSELRIWGVIKDLFNQARQKYSWLEGNPLDYLKTITSDIIDEEKFSARSLRRGIIVVPCKAGGLAAGLSSFVGIKSPRLRHAGDECFPAGTLVDTPFGKIPIEEIKSGDCIYSAAGIDTVKATMSRKCRSLLKILLKDKREIICTPNHPILTESGWQRAVDILPETSIVSTNEAMRIMREGVRSETKKTKVLQQNLQVARKEDLHRVWKPILCCGEKILLKAMSNEPVEEALQIMRERIYSTRNKSGFLFSVLRGEVETDAAGHCVENGSKQRLDFDWEKSQREHKEQSKGTVTQEETCKNGFGWSPMAAIRYENENSSGENYASNFPKCDAQLQNSNREKRKAGTASLLQNRLSLAGNKTGSRIRRELSQARIPAKERLSSGQVFDGARVESVTLYEPASDSGRAESETGYTVYNLAIEGHPSYSVNGLLMHNCQVMNDAFLNSYANWFGKQDFKGIMSGNFMETDDPLGVASEPENGWDSFVDTGKTQTWRSRFYGAMVVALDGRDSPNFDFSDHETKQHYPYLIGHKKLDGVAKTKGTDSWEWHSQCVGKPSKGMDIWRVFSKDFCIRHKAMEETNWQGTPRVELYSLDPAYGLGDLCVGRHLEFGSDVSGKQILFAHEPEIIPISISSGVEPEDQIAAYVKVRLEQLNITTKNCFYDSFGRGTLGFAFAKLFGSDCPVPIDTGMMPTKRPVRFDLYIEETPGGRKRHKRCDEHYTKFVTELWFSVREAVEAEQIRGLDMDTIREGCSRKFTKNNKNKIEVEPKDEMKKRLGRSPDKMDNLAIGVEGARQRGFRIERLGTDVVVKTNKNPSWLTRAAAEHQKIVKGHELVYD